MPSLKQLRHGWKVAQAQQRGFAKLLDMATTRRQQAIVNLKIAQDAKANATLRLCEAKKNKADADRIVKVLADEYVEAGGKL